MLKAYENVRELKYLVMKVTNGSFICEEIKGTLNSGNAYECLSLAYSLLNARILLWLEHYSVEIATMA